MVKEGEVINFLVASKKVGICQKGRIRYKSESKVDPGYTLACNGMLIIFLKLETDILSL